MKRRITMHNPATFMHVPTCLSLRFLSPHAARATMVRGQSKMVGSLVMSLLLLANALAQERRLTPPITNRIPANLFLTEAGDRPLFWHNRSGERLIEISRIEEAQRSTESRPATENPAGHWGQITNGFQLSLRFEKEVYTNGEPVVARMLVRNVGNLRQGYSFPARVAAVKNGASLKRKDDTGLVAVTVSTRFLYPQTQHLYQEDLKQIFDLTPGDYTFWAICNQGSISSEKVNVRIRN